MTGSRHELKKYFLDYLLPSGSCDFELIPQDASHRKYERVNCFNLSYILMDCPPKHYSLKPFIKVGNLLRDNNIKAPEIYHSDYESGFLLLEDFGKVRVKDILNNDLNHNYVIYKSIVELLTQIQTIKTDLLPHHNLQILAEGIELFVDWFVPLKECNFDVQVARERMNEIRNKYKNFKSEYKEKWLYLLKDLKNDTVALRDFHVENLMKTSSSQLGVLDFQDAAMSEKSYDLASLLQDARFNVPAKLESDIIKYYFDLNPQIEKEEFLTKYFLLAAQRNSRILGVFARKAILDNQPKYIKLIPLVLSYLARDLKHPSLREINNDLNILKVFD